MGSGDVKTVMGSTIEFADDEGGISELSGIRLQTRRPLEPHPRQKVMLRFSITGVIRKFDGRPYLP